MKTKLTAGKPSIKTEKGVHGYMRYSVPQYFRLCVYCSVLCRILLSYSYVSMCPYPKAFFRVKLRIFQNSSSYKVTLIYLFLHRTPCQWNLLFFSRPLCWD